MSMQEQPMDKGHQGAKRSSWSKLHFRDLALKVCQENPDLSVEDLALVFIEELGKFPGYMESIAVYIIANVKASLTPPRAAPSTSMMTRVVKQAAGLVLMQLQMPSGKTLEKSSGAECIKAGGWFVKVGMKVGPRGIVGMKLGEKDLRAMLEKSKK